MISMKCKVLLAALVLLCLVLSGCGPAPEWPVSVGGTDFEQAPGSVVSLSPVGTAALVELGYEDILVAVGSGCGYSPATKELPTVGSHRQPDTSAIAQLDPEVILLPEGDVHADLLALADENTVLICMPNVSSYEELLFDYRMIALLMDGNTVGAEKIEVLQTKTEETLAALSVGDEETKVTYLYVLTDDGNIAPHGCLESDLLALCGFANAAAEDMTFAPDPAALGALDPDVVLVDESVDIQALQEHEQLGKIPAVKNGDIIVLPNTPFVRLRLASIMETLTQFLQDYSK